MGLSLCQVERVDLRANTLHLLGLDLVDGTPVYDVKPYIPWDAVPTEALKVPSWVDKDDDEFAAVTWAPEAREAVARARAGGHLSPLYPPLKAKKKKAEGDGGEGGNDGEACEVCLAIGEVVAQDPRALHDGFGQATTDAYAMTFSALRVAFEVTRGGSGGRSVARVVEATEDPGDPTAPVGSYQHSMALRRKAEAAARARGWRALEWKHPVREGRIKGLYDLKKGAPWRPEGE